MYAVDSIIGSIIELTKIWVIFELGININNSQKGNTPKLLYKYMFSKVKYSWNWNSIKF